MIPHLIPIKITESADKKLLEISSDYTKKDFATQYDDGVQKFAFRRPDNPDYKSYKLIILFDVGKTSFEDSPDANDEYLLTESLTQYKNLKIYVTFEKPDGERTENSNHLAFTLREFPNTGEPPKPVPPTTYVKSKTNTIPEIWETDGGIPMYHSTLDGVDKEFGTGGGSSTMAWLPDVSEAGDLSWMRSNTTTPPAVQNIRGPAGEEIELQVANAHIQWKYLSEETWTNLVPLADIKGEPGDDGGIGPVGPDGLPGEPVELRKDEEYIQWKYESDTEWTDLVPLSALIGPPGTTGATGPAGPAGPAGQSLSPIGRYATLSDLIAAVPNPTVGLVYSVGTASPYTIYSYGYDDVSGGNTWIDQGTIEGPPGADGEDGNDGSDGADGREIALQTSATHIQWRYVGESGWQNLIALSAITGPQGLQGLTGLTGPSGTNGREVQLQLSSTHIQWRYTGDVEWTNLISIAEITGPQGEQGPPGDGAASNGVRNVITSTAAIDLSEENGNIFKVTPTSATEITFANLTLAVGTIKEFEVWVIQGETLHDVTWPEASIDWLITPPNMVADTTHVYTFRTSDGLRFIGSMCYADTGAGAVDINYVAVAAMLNWETIKASRTVGAEVWTGVMDGADKVYGKVVNLGNFPNATTKDVPHNIQNLKNKIYMQNVGNYGDGSLSAGNVAVSVGLQYMITFIFDNTVITIRTGTDRTTVTGYAFLTYTCTDR